MDGEVRGLEGGGRSGRGEGWDEGWALGRAEVTVGSMCRAEVTVGSMWVSSPGCPSWNWGQFGANDPLLLNLSFLRWEMVKMTESIS